MDNLSQTIMECQHRRFFLDEKALTSFVHLCSLELVCDSCNLAMLMQVYHVPGEPDSHACEIYGSCVSNSVGSAEDIIFIIIFIFDFK